jgi:hypothetical protein
MRLPLFVMLMLLTSISFAQNTGIGTLTPTEKLDVASGNVKIRDINATPGTVGVDKTVVVDANGVLKTIVPAQNPLFHAQLTANQSVPAAVTTLIYSVPITTSALFTYNDGTGEFTFNQEGNYRITMQASFGAAPANSQLVMGVRPVPDANYLARGSHFNAKTTIANLGELMRYTTVLTVATGAKVRFVATASVSCSVLATETDITGTGSVTNITIQKI